MLNKVILMGRITTDPELKHTPSNTAVCAFTLAVNRRFNRNETDFIDIVAWRQQAEFVSRYFKKGSCIVVCGSLQTRNWTDNQGQKRYVTEVVADEVSFGAPASAQGNEQRPQGQAYTPAAYGAPSFDSTPSANFEEIPGDESLPF